MSKALINCSTVQPPSTGTTRLMLAPMEGVVDYTFRNLLTQLGGLDRCVTEFVRVTEQRLPERVFYRFCPELQQNALTAAGTPVYIQLLGSHPEYMALNAGTAAELGASGIDINFGCPAKTVNKHRGGSILLNEPQQVYRIVSTCRAALSQTPLTVKIRLGYDNSDTFAEVCDAIIQAGADELTVHARTKAHGYKPPAYWQEINRISATASIPIIANGEIWNSDDAKQCQQDSGCLQLMLGRGILAQPGLARAIKYGEPSLTWRQVLPLLLAFASATEAYYEPKHVANRVKQWLGYLRWQYFEADRLFEKIKRLKCHKTIEHIISEAMV